MNNLINFSGMSHQFYQFVRENPWKSAIGLYFISGSLCVTIVRSSVFDSTNKRILKTEQKWESYSRFKKVVVVVSGAVCLISFVIIGIKAIWSITHLKWLSMSHLTFPPLHRLRIKIYFAD